MVVLIVWVELGGYVYDVTATQFDRVPKVFHVSKRKYDKWIRRQLIDLDRIITDDQVIEDLRGWPGWQSPLETHLQGRIRGFVYRIKKAHKDKT